MTTTNNPSPDYLKGVLDGRLEGMRGLTSAWTTDMEGIRGAMMALTSEVLLVEAELAQSLSAFFNGPPEAVMSRSARAAADAKLADLKSKRHVVYAQFKHFETVYSELRRVTLLRALLDYLEAHGMDEVIKSAGAAAAEARAEILGRTPA